MGETPLDAVDEGHSASFESAASRRVDHTTSPQRAALYPTRVIALNDGHLGLWNGHPCPFSIFMRQALRPAPQESSLNSAMPK